MKVCRKCGTEFSMKTCPACQKIRNAAWNAKNKERKKELFARWYVEHKEEQVKKAMKWNAEHPEKSKAAIKRWNKEHIEVKREHGRRWQAANPEKKRITVQNRRARIRNRGGKLSKDLVAKLFALQKGKCPCCGLPLGKDFHLDHKMPLVLGGAHEDANMQLLRKECNYKKFTKHPIDYMQEKGFLL